MGKAAPAYYCKQCTMERPTEEGVMRKTSWIPEKFATVGRPIYFGPKKQQDPEMWFVKIVPKDRMPVEYLVSHERDYKDQRKASDI